MGRVLPIDLAYKKARDFGICLIEARRGKPVKAEFIPPDALINDAPEAGQCARAILEFCKKHRVRVVFLLFRLQELFRFRADRIPTHDELQALVAGMAGVSILAGKPARYCVQGSPPREVNGVIVEGFIVNPCIERSAV
jgi:hypothetical protein